MQILKLNLQWYYKTTNDVQNTPNMFSTKEIPRNAGEVWFYHAPSFIISNSAQIWPEEAGFFFTIQIEFEEQQSSGTNNQTEQESKQKMNQKWLHFPNAVI